MVDANAISANERYLNELNAKARPWVSNGKWASVLTNSDSDIALLLK